MPESYESEGAISSAGMAAVRGGARVDHRPRDGEFTCRTGPQLGREKPP